MSKIDDLMPNTPDLNKERLQKLKELFPDLFTIEGKLNPDELKKIIDPELVHETERFEFKWFGKSEAKRTAFTPSKATLIYDEDRSVNPDDANGNMIIKGENLESLKCLLSAYRERIKCIYIDPPYNTGNDFVYSDKWDISKEDYWEHIGVTEEGIKIDTNTDSSGRYHSNWLNMMYARLLLARQLLKDEGVIFISIDDIELHHVRKICDEIFGEENFFAILTRKAMHTVRNSSKDFNKNADYIITYAKNKKWFDEDKSRYIREIKDKTDNYPYDDNDGLGAYKLDPLSARNYYTPYKHKFKNGTIWEAPSGSYPRYSEKTLNWMESDNRIVFSGKEPKAKRYLNEVQEGQPPDVILKTENVGFNFHGTKILAEIINSDKLFSQPKPIELIMYLISLLRNNNGIFLDFFAGSGTTAHAVMDLNKEDGGNRKFILVQLPEQTDSKSEAYKAGYKKISDITIERNKRVIERIKKEQKDNKGLFEDKQYNPGFKVYKLAKSNFPRVDFQSDPDKSEDENVKLLKKYIAEKEATFDFAFNENDIFDEVLLKNGFMLNYKLEQIKDFGKNKVYKVNDEYKEGLVCLDVSIDNKTIGDLEKYKDKLFICLERALDTTKKWNLKHALGDKLIAF